MMEKQGVIREGVTPPENADKDKQAADEKQGKRKEDELEQDPIRRLSDRVADNS
jgi:hypothetical protein